MGGDDAGVMAGFRTPSFESGLGELAGMRRLARSLLRDHALADDVLQDAALAAWRRETDGEPPSRGWWSAVVRNLASKLTRGRRRRLTHEHAAARPEAQPGADAVVERLALHRAVVAAIETLAPPYRDVVIRRWFDGQEPQRIADELGVPLATVKTRLRRALVQLREKLHGEWGDNAAGALVVLAGPRAMPQAMPDAAQRAMPHTTPHTTPHATWHGTPVAVAGSVAGVLVMGAKLKVVAMLVIAGALLAWGANEWWMRRAPLPARDSSPPTRSVASTTAPASAEPGAPLAMTPVATRVGQPLATEPALPAADDPRRFAAIRGTVHGPTGALFGGARVALVRLVGSDLHLHSHAAVADELPERRLEAVSAADGSFEFAAVPRGAAFTIEARAQPDLRGALSGIRAGDAEVRVTIWPFARLAGVVRRPRGNPIEGATVVARTVGGASVEIEQRTATDRFGHFELDGLPSEPVDVLAITSAGDLATPVVAELRSGETTEIELLIGDELAVEGRVVDDATGQPLAQATLYGEGDLGGDIPVAVTDAAGRFRLQTRLTWGGPPPFFLRARGYGCRQVSVPVPSAPPAVVELRLARGHTIRGRLVVAADGRPVADAVVALFPMVERTDATRFSPANECVATRSAADGTFALEEVDPRVDQTLLVRHEANAGVERLLRGSAAASADLELGDLVVEEGALVAGRVLDEAGKPVANAHVLLEPDCDPEVPAADGHSRTGAPFLADARNHETRSRSDGSFGFATVAAGRWIAAARVRDQGGRAVLSLTVRAGDLIEGIELRMAAGLAIAGRVVDRAGGPVDRVWVSIYSDATGSSAPVQQLAKPDGSFRVSGLAPGSYRVVAQVPGRQTKSPRRFVKTTLDSIAAGRTDLTIVMRDGSLLVGSVTTAKGAAVAGAGLSVFDSDQEFVAGGQADDAGRFELLVPAEGRLRVELRATPHESPASPPTGAADLTLDDVEADGREIAIQLPKRDT